MSQDRLWVFERPLLRDWLFLLGLVLGVVNLMATLASLGDLGWLAAVLGIALAFPAGVLIVGIVGGTARQYLRARADA